ncbi:MAG: cupin domain-containing protein [Dermatophilaceae bacterium]
MSVDDIGPRPNAFDIETATRENSTYRTVVWTGAHLQVTLMSIPPGSSVGLEAHPDTDQFLRLDAGRGRVTMGPSEDDLSFVQEVEDGWCVTVPAGTWHDIVNIGETDMRLYAIYAPVHHAAGIVQPTAQDAERDEENGTDVPPSWAVAPQTGSDEHGG